jgi:hypothetical protein
VDFLNLFADQERHGFPDLAGSEGQGTIRVSERLLNVIIGEQLRGSASIKEVHVTPRPADKFGVRLVVAKPSFLPPISLEVTIDKQPALPEDAVLAMTLSGLGGLLRFAGPAAAFMNVLPPGVRMEGERVFVDIRALLAARGLASALDYVQAVRVTTEAGRLLVSFQGRVRD